MDWNRLPATAKLRILHLFVTSSSDVDADKVITVCKEWHDSIEAIERKMFTSVEEQYFSGSVRRRSMLKHLRLNIAVHDDSFSRRRDWLLWWEYGAEVIPMLDFIRTWEDNGNLRHRYSICLELSNFPWNGKTISDRHNIGLTRDLWRWGKQPPLDPFEPVYSITKVAVPQENHINFCEDTLSKLFLSLPRLSHIHLETENRTWNFQQFTEPKLTVAFQELPPWVKSINIIQHGEGTDKSNRWERETFCDLATAVVARSRFLEELALVDLIEAYHFVKGAVKLQPQTWDNLQYLTLTSDLLLRDDLLGPPTALTRERQDASVKVLLDEAAVAIVGMPVLRIMEIFNASDRSAAFFNYEAANGSAMCLWSSTYQFTVPWTTKQRWMRANEKKGIWLNVYPEVFVPDYSGDARAEFVNSRLSARKRAHRDELLWT
ncbi:hypothetical protein AK830_g8067 [Neonectria ditissima]|uniref:DUF6546 domain-containing protein n=1 Tax=Neonectria ditissima TaxID=78410 RepID=A0A0P7AL30_9HYPO|nr:hypothetical protein AK830_g8067 [Neonectria ditissima]